MVRHEDAVLVLFRMREVVLRSSLSGNTLMMQPSSTWFRASFRTRCMDLLIRKVPMPSAASKSISSGVRPTISPSRSAPTNVRWTARCRMGSSMLSRAARISSTVQMVRSCVDFLGLSTGTGLLTRMPHSTAYWNAVPSSRCTSWIVVPERKRCFCFSVSSCFFPSIYEPQGVLLRVV